MTPGEAAQRREAVVMHSHTDAKDRYSGEAVYSITEKGIVIAHNETRIFYPWSRVTSFSYHNLDTAARMVIQGY